MARKAPEDLSFFDTVLYSIRYIATVFNLAGLPHKALRLHERNSPITATQYFPTLTWHTVSIGQTIIAMQRVHQI